MSSVSLQSKVKISQAYFREMHKQCVLSVYPQIQIFDFLGNVVTSELLLAAHGEVANVGRRGDYVMT